MLTLMERIEKDTEQQEMRGTGYKEKAICAHLYGLAEWVGIMIWWIVGALLVGLRV